MFPSYLVDTDWIIHYLNGQPSIVSKLQELQGRGVAVSLVSSAELYEGVFYSRDPEAGESNLDDFLRGVSIAIDKETCKVFSRQRGRLRAKKKTVADFDLLIAATALRHDITLLTNNRRHFEMIERFEWNPWNFHQRKKRYAVSRVKDKIRWRR